MKIAIHAADLDHERIDGTRVYIFNMLKNFGSIDSKNSFCIYHQNEFNPQLTPPNFESYLIKKMPFPRFWTQLRFAFEIFRDNPDILWMPMHNVPMFRRKNLRVVVTIHDLAFKIFPGYFPKKDLVKLNRLSDYAVKNANHLIAVSQSTKDDILRFYPETSPEKITVIHHGFDSELYDKEIPQSESELILKSYNLTPNSYLLYVGAIQPRKNLGVLIAAFEKTKAKHSDFKLILAGERAWMSEETLDRIAASPFKDDIIVTGTIVFEHLPALYQNATAFVFPSLYEGFGIPVLEAFASGTPAILASNSSLLEVGGDSALFFETEDSDDLSQKIESVLSDESLRKSLIEKGKMRSKNFSWQRCAKETLECLLS